VADEAKDGGSLLWAFSFGVGGNVGGSLGFPGTVPLEIPSCACLFGGISDFSRSRMSCGALSVGGLGTFLGGTAMLKPITCVGLVCFVAGQSRNSDARSEGPDGPRTDLGFDADPILIGFNMLSAELDLLHIGHLKSKSLYQTFSGGAGFIHSCRVEPTPDGHVCNSIADPHNTAESLIR